MRTSSEFGCLVHTSLNPLYCVSVLPGISCQKESAVWHPLADLLLLCVDTTCTTSILCKIYRIFASSFCCSCLKYFFYFFTFTSFPQEAPFCLWRILENIIYYNYNNNNTEHDMKQKRGVGESGTTVLQCQNSFINSFQVLRIGGKTKVSGLWMSLFCLSVECLCSACQFVNVSVLPVSLCLVTHSIKINDLDILVDH